MKELGLVYKLFGIWRKEGNLTNFILDNWIISMIYICNSRRRQWHPTPVLLPGKSMDGGAWWAAVHGVARSWTRLNDFTFTFHFSLSCIGEGNGNPLQCSCLENPRDGEAWWAAIYGVAQSRTRLKWLSSIHVILEEENFVLSKDMFKASENHAVGYWSTRKLKHHLTHGIKKSA